MNTQGVLPPSQEVATSTQPNNQQPLPMDNALNQPTVLSTSPTDAGNIAEPIATAPTSTGHTSAKPALPTVEYVEIANHQFAPASITIKQGTVIKWTNDDPMPHSVVADDAPFQSPPLNRTDGFTFTFDQTGTYTYHCGIHPDMHGTVIVTP